MAIKSSKMWDKDIIFSIFMCIPTPLRGQRLQRGERCGLRIFLFPKVAHISTKLKFEGLCNLGIIILFWDS